MTAAATPYGSDLPTGRDGFVPMLHAEWTKFRTVRGWVIGAVIAGLVIVLFAYLATFRHVAGTTCPGSPPPSASSTPCLRVVQPHIPIGPGGGAVTDTYYLVHRTLDGDGSITVRVGALSGRIQTGSGAVVSAGDLVGAPGRVQPWAKAGLIVTATTRPGSRYAAIMLTGGHGVRMQYDYTHDIAAPGAPVRAPRWLRLTRSGDTLTSFQSADGIGWTRVGAVHLAGLPKAVQAGLFVTSPQAVADSSQQYFGGQGGVNLQSTAATAGFDGLGLRGSWQTGGWRGRQVGANPQLPTLSSVGYQRTGAGFRISGSGDIAPAVGIPIAHTDQTALTGVFLGLIVAIVLGTMFITAEYRRGLIETTLTASPRRGRMLAAKALVIAVVTFVAGAVACAVAVTLGNHILRSNGNFVYPTGTATELRVILGTAALMALVAVLALALGTALRRSAAAVTAAIILVVLPYVLAVASALPASVAEWLLRLTPAAAFAVQQTLPAYHQVNYLYTPAGGFYPLAPGVGLAVLFAYALAALALAHRLLRTRDA
jgi:ABC-type transport system involved in multi-copper enzyme maturation permease subunit